MEILENFWHKFRSNRFLSRLFHLERKHLSKKNVSRQMVQTIREIHIWIFLNFYIFFYLVFHSKLFYACNQECTIFSVNFFILNN